MTVETRRAVEWTLERPGQLNRSVRTLPNPTAGEILVATRLGAVSPGTERTLLHGSAPAVTAASYPHQPGYLNVVEIIDAPDRTLVGERGVALLGHRDLALIPYHRFLRMPAEAPDESGLLGVLAADASHALDTAVVEKEEDCLVIGGGILGVLSTWELCLRTRGRIVLVERDPQRRGLLAGITWPGGTEITDAPGHHRFHNVFDCAGSATGFTLAQQSARAQGSIVLVSDGSHEPYVLAEDFFRRGLFLGKTDSHPDLRTFLGEYFTRGEDRGSLLDVAFRDEIRFADFPQAYLESLLAAPAERRGLLPRVVYPAAPGA